MNEFATVLTCMDGRIQRKVNDYLQTVFGARNIDTITTAGTVKHLATETDQTSTLLANLRISTEGHGSTQIAVVAHHDCAGNPVPDDVQRGQIAESVAYLSNQHPTAEVIGLFLDKNWVVEKVAR